jgi:transcriptional regulator with XRE-family HTH domain
MNKNPLPDDLPADLRAYLDSVPPATPEMTARVAAANRALEDDPTFQADYLKSLFVEKMYAALNERRETKSTLAERLGKTRQYIQKLFNEDKRVNFTVDTLCAVAHALGRRVHLHICREHEQLVIVTRPRTPVILKAIVWDRPKAAVHPALVADSFVMSTAVLPVSTRKEVPGEYPIAA